MSLNFDTLRAVNVARANRWHGGDFTMWSANDWAIGVSEEVFECLAKLFGALKRIRRIEDDIASTDLRSREQLLKALADEMADVLLYLDLLAAKFGIDLGEAVREKFNITSHKYNFPERL